MGVHRILCGVLGALLMLAGPILIVGLFQYHMPDSAGGPFAVGPWGAYLMAMTGSALAAWGGCLLGAARLDRDGFGRFVDVRTDVHHWLDATCTRDALATIR